MNRSIVHLANVILAGFLIVAGLLFYWQVVQATALTADATLNRTRLLEAERRSKRGLILDRNGAVLARNEVTDDGPRRVYSLPSFVHVVGYHSARFGNSAVGRRESAL